MQCFVLGLPALTLPFLTRIAPITDIVEIADIIYRQSTFRFWNSRIVGDGVGFGLQCWFWVCVVGMLKKDTLAKTNIIHH